MRAALVIVALLLAFPGAAHAHAELVASSPQRTAQLDAAPRQVSLRFNEPVEAGLGALRVFDARGERVDDGQVTRPGRESDVVGTVLRGGLGDGAYTATFRVVSADGHVVSGGFVFSVGERGAAPVATVDELIDRGESGPATTAAFGTVRGLAYLAIALAVGGLVFLVTVWLPGLRAASGADESWSVASRVFAARFARLVAVTVALGAVTTILGVVLQGANAGGTSFWAALDPGVVGDVLGTRFGAVWGLRLVGWLLLGTVALAAATRGRVTVLRPVSLGATGLAAGRAGSPVVLALLALPFGFLAASPGLSGHAGASEPAALVLAANTLHVLAMSVWLGGLAALVLVLPAATRRLEPPDRTRLLAACLRRFSPLALASVAALLATGIAQSIVHLEAIGDLTGSAFGRSILIKAALTVALVALGALNLRHSRPRLERLAAAGGAPGGAGRTLRRAVRAEAALLVAVLGVTAALTSYPPPGAAAAGPFSTSGELGSARLEVIADPASSGANEIHLYLFDRRDGGQYDRFRDLRVQLRLPERGIGPLEPRLHKAGPGHYVARRALVAPAGDWELDVAARVSEFEEQRVEIELPIR